MVLTLFSQPDVIYTDAAGNATLTVTPPTSGSVTLGVRTFDRTFNPSPPTTYRVIVTASAW